jgi:hypothetical protein
MADVEAPSNVGQGLSGFPSRLGFCDLMQGELWLPSKPHSPSHRPSSTFACSGEDHRAFKLCQGPKNRQDQPSMRACGADHRIGKRSETSTFFSDGVQDIQKITG